MTRILAIGLGLLCGGAIYAAVPKHHDDLRADRQVARAIDRIDPPEAHVHGCVTRFGEPATQAVVQLQRPAKHHSAVFLAHEVNRAGCFDLDATYRSLGAAELWVSVGHGEDTWIPIDVHAGDRLELGTIDVRQQRVRGVVRDRDGHTLAGVRIGDDRTTDLTDQDGAYTLFFDAPGRHQLRVTRYAATGLTALATVPAVIDVDAITDEPIRRDITLEIPSPPGW